MFAALMLGASAASHGALITGTSTGAFGGCGESTPYAACTSTSSTLSWGPTTSSGGTTPIAGQTSTLTALGTQSFAGTGPLSGVVVGGFSWFNDTISATPPTSSWTALFSYSLNFDFTSPAPGANGSTDALGGSNGFTITNVYGEETKDGGKSDTIKLADLSAYALTLTGFNGSFLVDNFRYAIASSQVITSCGAGEDDEHHHVEGGGSTCYKTVMNAGSLGSGEHAGSGTTWSMSENTTGALWITADISYLAGFGANAPLNVPEPAPLSALGLGILAMGMACWIRRCRAA